MIDSTLLLWHYLFPLPYIGSYEPFSEENVDQFERSSDSIKDSPFSDLRSSYRQTIIDFIIRSRIRDSGAELG